MVLRLHGSQRQSNPAVFSTATATVITLLLMLLLVVQLALVVSVRGEDDDHATHVHCPRLFPAGSGLPETLRRAVVTDGGGGTTTKGIPAMLRPATTMPVSNRKLLQKGTRTAVKPPTAAAQRDPPTINSTASAAAQPFRIGFGCSYDDVAVYQSATDKLPSGIPTFTVRVLNVCASGCAVTGIHVSCGWYSSARLVNPKVFRRLGFDDCLVNDGRPIPPGEALVFTYADTRKYTMAVRTLSCVPNT